MEIARRVVSDALAIEVYDQEVTGFRSDGAVHGLDDRRLLELRSVHAAGAAVDLPLHDILRVIRLRSSPPDRHRP
jgi:hypothetical protein